VGHPIKILITGGQAHDSTATLALLEDQNPKAILTDKAHDNNELREHIKQMNAKAVIPSKRNRKQLIAHNTHFAVSK